jgi:hypothetical protein
MFKLHGAASGDELDNDDGDGTEQKDVYEAGFM